MKKSIKLSLVFSLVGILAGVVTAFQTIPSLPLEQEVNTAILAGVMGVQVGILTFVLSLLGFKLMERTELQLIKKEINKPSVLLALSFAFITGLVIVGADYLVFSNILSVVADNLPQFSLLGLASGVLYGGLVEEVMLRLFFMTLLVFIFTKILKRMDIPPVYYWIAIVLSSLLFAIGHLPANAMIFGSLTGLIIFRAMLLNVIGGIFFGYLYWKHGFWYGVLAHAMTHLFMQLVFIPIFQVF